MALMVESTEVVYDWPRYWTRRRVLDEQYPSEQDRRRSSPGGSGQVRV